MADDSMERGTTMTLTFEGSEIKEPIHILAWSWGVSFNTMAGSDRYGNKVKKGAYPQEFSLTKYIGVESPLLAEWTAKNTKLSSVVLKAENKNQNMSFTMKNASVVGISTGGSGGEDRLTENIVLSFAEVEYAVTSKTAKGKANKRASKIKATK